MRSQNTTEAQQRLLIQNAKYENDIRRLLRPWYSFRLFIKFKKINTGRQGQKHDTGHFYGYEEDCTYRQCFHGHAKVINLDKLKGYKECIWMAEEKYAGRFKYAAIYGRIITPNGEFDIEHRYYNEKGELDRVQDPILTEANNQVLYHTKVGGFLYVHQEKDIAPEQILADHHDWGKELAATKL